MARTIHKLTALSANKTVAPGRYGDGAGLWLQVSPSLSKSWVFRYMLDGKAREMGLGPLRDVSLAEARAKAAECRKQLLGGTDPLHLRDEARIKLQLAAASDKTFKHCAESYIEAHRAGWKNPKHIDQWSNTLATYCHPSIGNLPVAAIDTARVLRVLEPIWTDKTETASRVRGRIEAILDWAAVRGYRQGLNPARWKGHLDQTLPKRSTVKKVRHHPALPYGQLATFVAALRTQEGLAARALEFTIYTVARTGESVNARWDEFDLENRVWTVPADRMKAKREHRVPLSKQAMTILAELAQQRQSEFVFPGRNVKKPLSNMAMLKTLERMKRDDLTSHGFRSSFRDWAAESTAYPPEVVEMALAHTISNKVEAAYRRGDLIGKRAQLMRDWGIFCATVRPEGVGNVVPINRTSDVPTNPIDNDHGNARAATN